ncbi:DUF4973 domain-containing protein [Bacteroides faecis]|uniref:DUF4973 domain-containing protein n=1 Tax=Bacteroides faecis TaxID=674529 RepID=UPI002165EF82|nr:DUF4973 domain-containing protein [Bacteroides faecis]MCS3305812.1 DUF4973 domain-containing protein [Bacteroides faecis]
MNTTFLSVHNSDSKGVTNIYVPYSRHDAEGNYAEGGEGRSNYQLPILVSGSTDNPSNVTVHVAHDADTLNILNYARYLYTYRTIYEDMGAEGLAYASYPESLLIKAKKKIKVCWILNLIFATLICQRNGYFHCRL